MSKMNKNAEAVAAIPAALYSACDVGIVPKVSMKVGMSSRPFRTPEFFVLGSAAPDPPVPVRGGSGLGRGRHQRLRLIATFAGTPVLSMMPGSASGGAQIADSVFRLRSAVRSMEW